MKLNWFAALEWRKSLSDRQQVEVYTVCAGEKIYPIGKVHPVLRQQRAEVCAVDEIHPIFVVLQSEIESIDKVCAVGKVDPISCSYKFIRSVVRQ